MNNGTSYIVFKITDVNRHLDEVQAAQILEIAAAIEKGRYMRRQQPLECVVVESEWAIYDQTLDALTRLSENRPQQIDELSGYINAAKAKAESIVKTMWQDFYIGKLGHEPIPCNSLAGVLAQIEGLYSRVREDWETEINDPQPPASTIAQFFLRLFRRGSES